MDFPQFQDLFQIGANTILTLNGAVTVDAVNRAGTDINIDVASAAAIGDECIGQLTNVAAGTFLDSAQKTALDRVIFDRYGLLRNPASPAVGSVQFLVVGANGLPVANPAAFALPAGLVLQTPSGAQFVTTASEVYPTNNAAPVTAAVQSVLAGSAQQAAPGTITGVVSNVPGGPSSPFSLVVTNPLATAGATDEESDSDFRARARAFFSTARRGTLAAIAQGALGAGLGVKTAATFEFIDLTGAPARGVELVISDVYTDSLANLSTIPPTYAAQSQVLALNVFNALADVRAGGINVSVVVGQVVLQPIQLNLSFAASANTLPGGIDGVALQARAAAVAYTNGNPPGAVWSAAAAQAAVAATPGLQVTGNEIASPQGNVIPTALQVIRTSLAIVLATAMGTGTVLQATFNPDAVGN